MASSARIDELKKKFDENPRRYFAPLANEFRKAGDLEQAIIICEEFLPQQPGHMSGHIVYGQALFEAGRMPESRTVFETALGLDPENLIALRHLGDIARGQGDAPTARSWYMRVLDADPRNDEIQGLLTALDAESPAPEAPADVAVEPEAVEEVMLSFEPEPEPEPVSSTAETVQIPAHPQSFDIEKEEPSLGSEAAVDEEHGFEIPVIPTAAAPTPPAGVTLLDGFSLSGMDDTADAEPATSHAPAEGFETTSFTPPEEAIAPVDLDASLDSGVPSFEAPSAPVAALEGLEGTAAAEPDELRESEAPAVDATLDDLALDDGLVLPPQGDPLATPITNPAIPAVPSQPFTSLTPTAPMAAYPRPESWPEAPADAEPLELLEEEGIEAEVITEPIAEVVAEPIAEVVAEPTAELETADVSAVAFAGDALPVELPASVIAAETELLDEGGLLPPESTADEAADAPPTGTPFATETMAELYMAQGFPDQARAVYAQLLDASPGDQRLQGLIAGLDAQVTSADEGPTAREFFARMASRRPVSRAADIPPSDDDFGPAAASDPAAAPFHESADFSAMGDFDLADSGLPQLDDETVTEVSAAELAVEAEILPDFEPVAAVEHEPPRAPEAVAPAIERAAAMRTPGGSIDALFSNRAPGTSEDSAASALAQAFGATAETEPVIAGRPAHSAASELSLDSVFRDGGARPPRSSQNFSFDQFFAGGEAKGAPAPRTSGEVTPAEEPAERSADDIEQFNSWLQGLKPR